RQVRGDLVPRLAVIEAPEQELRAEIEDARPGRRLVDRRVPVEPVLRVARDRERLDVARLAGLDVDPRDRSALRFGVDVVRIRAVAHRPEAVPAADVLPALVPDAADRLRRPHPRAVVLEAA